jgi:hypothetical protein
MGSPISDMISDPAVCSPKDIGQENDIIMTAEVALSGVIMIFRRINVTCVKF